MRTIAIALLLTFTLSGCGSLREVGEESGASIGDLGSSFRGGLGQNTDTYGTMRRVDVYGGSTAPSLPSIGTPGLGK